MALSGWSSSRDGTDTEQGLGSARGFGPGCKRVSRPRGDRAPVRSLISFPVVLADYEGQDYLVSMLGDQANW